MSGARRALAAGSVIVLGFGLGACGNDSDEDEQGGGARDAATTTAGPGPTTTSTTEAVETIRVEVRDGEVVGGSRRVRVDLGEPVRVAVVSDVADEIHVHGYDRFADVEAGGRATVELVADIPGIFEAELEGRNLTLLELEVR